MILFIDTHLNDVAIILYNDGKIIEKKIVSNVRQQSTIIMPTLVEILKDRKPSSIIVVNGPGSFTGVRLGVTIAKTLAYTLNIPIRTISSLECLAISNNYKTVALNDNNGYYVGIIDENNNICEYKYLTNKEFASFAKDNKTMINGDITYEKVIEFVLRKNPINPHKVNPIYVKKLDVEK